MSLVFGVNGAIVNAQMKGGGGCTKREVVKHGSEKEGDKKKTIRREEHGVGVLLLLTALHPPRQMRNSWTLIGLRLPIVGSVSLFCAFVPFFCLRITLPFSLDTLVALHEFPAVG